MVDTSKQSAGRGAASETGTHPAIDDRLLKLVREFPRSVSCNPFLVLRGVVSEQVVAEQRQQVTQDALKTRRRGVLQNAANPRQVRHLLHCVAVYVREDAPIASLEASGQHNARGQSLHSAHGKLQRACARQRVTSLSHTRNIARS